MQPPQHETGLDIRLSWYLPDNPRAAVAARQAVRTAWNRWALSGDDMTPRLLITELVTNALKHAYPPMRLSLTKQAVGTVLFEVSDSSSVPPTPRDPGPGTIGGWGLVLLERLAQSWGYRLTNEGKVVWFLLAPAQNTAR